MAKITISGASDDLIEIEGDLREEFNPTGDEEPGYLAVSDGTLLSIHYTGGFWRINRLVEGSAVYTKVDGTDEDSDYSDKATLEGDGLTWVVYGHQMERSKKRK